MEREREKEGENPIAREKGGRRERKGGREEKIFPCIIAGRSFAIFASSPLLSYVHVTAFEQREDGGGKYQYKQKTEVLNNFLHASLVLLFFPPIAAPPLPPFPSAPFPSSLDPSLPCGSYRNPFVEREVVLTDTPAQAAEEEEEAKEVRYRSRREAAPAFDASNSNWGPCDRPFYVYRPSPPPPPQPPLQLPPPQPLPQPPLPLLPPPNWPDPVPPVHNFPWQQVLTVCTID